VRVIEPMQAADNVRGSHRLNRRDWASVVYITRSRIFLPRRRNHTSACTVRSAFSFAWLRSRRRSATRDRFGGAGASPQISSRPDVWANIRRTERGRSPISSDARSFTSSDAGMRSSKTWGIALLTELQNCPGEPASFRCSPVSATRSFTSAARILHSVRCGSEHLVPRVCARPPRSPRRLLYHV